MTPPDADWVPALPCDSLEPNDSIAVIVKGRSLLLCRVVDEVYAIANRCSHAAMPLEGGRIRGHYLTCPFHGARFDLRSGAASGPTRVPIETFPTRIVDGRVLVSVQ